MKKRFNPLQYSLLVFAATGLGCASRTVQQTPVLPAENRAVLSAVREALERDAMGESAAHLYEPFVTIIANGVERRDPPRFAGIGEDGRVTVSELRGEVLGDLAWAIASYHWTSADRRVVESARVTFILAPEGGSWRIRHAHSSVVPPWARDGLGKRPANEYQLRIAAPHFLRNIPSHIPQTCRSRLRVAPPAHSIAYPLRRVWANNSQDQIDDVTECGQP